eukprot:c15084_g2_i2.p1 GENE.c15084_g2_i2~~c15084_g2_i2.p1  ORF type:complete len:224 (+),score=38.65 c15084_g2_i2:64-672(+)
MEKMLLHYWTLGFPTTPLSGRLSKDWGRLGFQGKDPATDFRGAGFFGLTNLVHLATEYGPAFRAAIERIEARDGYPFSIAGLAITMMVFNLAGQRGRFTELLFGRDSELCFDSVVTAPDGSNALSRTRPREDYLFEECYCAGIFVLDAMWWEMNATYMDFPAVLKAATTRYASLSEQWRGYEDVRAFNDERSTALLLGAGKL